MGDVLQITSGKAGLLPKLGFSQAEGVHPVVGQARQEHDPGHTGQASRGTGRQLAQFKQLDGSRHAQCRAGLI